MRRRDVISWCLYDFANSVYAAVIVATVWAAYYANVVVGNDAGQGDLWWGRSVSAAMLLVAITSPLAGALADCGGWRKRLLTLYTLVAVFGTALLALVEPGMIRFGFALTVLATFGFEGAIVFYNAYLPELAPAGWRGRLSAWGYATGYLGSLLGLLAVLPLVKAEKYGETYLVVAATFLVFALPALLWLPADRARTSGAARIATRGAVATWRTLREIVATPGLRLFVLAYFLYINGVNTVIYFSSIFAQQTLGFAMSDLIVLFLVVQATALVGSLAWAGWTDRLGPRRVLLFLLLQWSLIVVGAYYVDRRDLFYLLAALAGTGLGALQAASRAFMARLLPAGREGEFFGFYALSGKSAAILGPLVFGVVSVWSGGNQRLSVLSVLLFLVAGGVLLHRVPEGGVPSPALPSAPAHKG
jgi:UMF1 family MFS transporter